MDNYLLIKFMAASVPPFSCLVYNRFCISEISKITVHVILVATVRHHTQNAEQRSYSRVLSATPRPWYGVRRTKWRHSGLGTRHEVPSPSSPIPAAPILRAPIRPTDAAETVMLLADQFYRWGQWPVTRGLTAISEKSKGHK